MDWKGDGLRNMRSGRAIKEPKLTRRNRKVVILNVFRVDKTMARTGVNQGKKTKDGSDWRIIKKSIRDNHIFLRSL